MRAVMVAFTLLILSLSSAFAQDESCPAQIEQALAAVQDSCAETGRNQACYGNLSLQATAHPEAPAFIFEQRGDVVDLAHLMDLVVSPLDQGTGHWGIALLRLQANLQDTLPGQNVTMLLFGDVQITNDVQPGERVFRPMQAFTFRTGLGRPECAEVPTDGILIQTPTGAGQIALRANGVSILLGSTAFLTAQPGQSMTISVVEGEAAITVEGVSVTVEAGMETSIPMDDDLNPDGEPSEPTPYELARLERLPLALLPEEIIIEGSEVELDDQAEQAPPEVETSVPESGSGDGSPSPPTDDNDGGDDDGGDDDGGGDD
jgi:hypothetical protein